MAEKEQSVDASPAVASLGEVTLARVNSREQKTSPSTPPAPAASKCSDLTSIEKVAKAASRQSISDGELAALVRSMLGQRQEDEIETPSEPQKAPQLPAQPEKEVVAQTVKQVGVGAGESHPVQPAAQGALAEPVQIDARTCCLCLCEEPRDKGLECENECFACDECFSAHVGRPEALCEDRPGYIKCCASESKECQATYTFQLAARHATSDAFEALRRNDNDRRTIVMQGEFEAWKEQFAAKSEEERRVMFARKEIEDLVSLRCPRCRQVFAEYDGCAALTCAKAGCHAPFCALCLTDTGVDAHAHVKACRLNPKKGSCELNHSPHRIKHRIHLACCISHIRPMFFRTHAAPLTLNGPSFRSLPSPPPSSLRARPCEPSDVALDHGPAAAGEAAGVLAEPATARACGARRRWQRARHREGFQSHARTARGRLCLRGAGGDDARNGFPR